jgi:outer membrane lipoprotein-sorting protein
MKIETILSDEFTKKFMTRQKRYSSLCLSISVLPLLILCLLFFLFSFETAEAEEKTDRILNEWIEKQSKIKRWSSDVLQIRELKSLVRPLETSGRVWVEPPDRFCWQLGEPAKTIAIQTGEELVIIYPRLKQIERYPEKDIVDPAWKQVMALLDAGFPTDSKTFFELYKVNSITRSDETWRFELLPAAMEGRKLLDRVRIEVTSDDLTLVATELVFSDGSSMRNEFSNHDLNPEMDEELFEVPVHEGFQVIYPVKQKN